MYYKGYYKGLSENEIKKRIVREGYSPIKYTDTPGFTYSTHKHPETKLLAFLNGVMEARVGNTVYKCSRDDKLIIPGNTTHSAIVGSSGCVFFWSEKLLHPSCSSLQPVRAKKWIRWVDTIPVANYLISAS